MRALLDRATQEVKDYTVQYEDQVKLVNALGSDMNAPENKVVLDVLAMRERRMDAALVKEANAIDNFTMFCVAEKSASQAQSASAAYIRSCPVFGCRRHYYYYYSATYITRHLQQENHEAEAAGTEQWMEGPLR